MTAGRNPFLAKAGFVAGGWLLISLAGAYVVWQAQPKDFLPIAGRSALTWACIFAAVALFNALSKARRAAQARADAAWQSQLRTYFSRPLVPVAAPNFMLKKDESCYYTAPATLYSMHKERTYQGGYGGVSVRLARGIWVRSGGGRAIPVTSQKMKSDGEGTVYLTDRRLVFVGATKSVEIPFTKMASVEPYADGLRVDVANKTPVVIRTGDRWLYVHVWRVHAGRLAALSQSEVAALTSDVAEGEVQAASPATGA
jgi:hypothetical protein